MTVTASRVSGRRLVPGNTPARMRLLLAVLVLASLAWGALAAFTVSHYSSTASGVVTTREPLSLDALQVYRRLADANDAATTAFLTGWRSRSAPPTCARRPR